MNIFQCVRHERVVIPFDFIIRLFSGIMTKAARWLTSLLNTGWSFVVKSAWSLTPGALPPSFRCFPNPPLMVSSGGPEEDSATGVWKSLPEWECRARGSAQWSAPEMASGPSCRAPKRSRWPNDTILPNLGFASLILMSKSCAVKRGSSCLRVSQSSRHTGRGDLICCALSVVTRSSHAF